MLGWPTGSSFNYLCTNLHVQHQGSLVHVMKQTGLVGWRALHWGPEWHTHWVCYPVCQHPIPAWNKHQTPCKPCTKQDMWNQTWYVPLIPWGHFFPQLYLKTVRGMSSLKLFNNAQTHCVYHKHLFTWILYLIHCISGPFVWTPTWLCISQVN